MMMTLYSKLLHLEKGNYHNNMLYASSSAFVFSSVAMVIYRYFEILVATWGSSVRVFPKLSLFTAIVSPKFPLFTAIVSPEFPLFRRSFVVTPEFAFANTAEWNRLTEVTTLVQIEKFHPRWSINIGGIHCRAIELEIHPNRSAQWCAWPTCPSCLPSTFVCCCCRTSSSSMARQCMPPMLIDHRGCNCSI